MESISMFGRTSLTFSTGIYNQNPELQMLHALIIFWRRIRRQNEKAIITNYNDGDMDGC